MPGGCDKVKTSRFFLKTVVPTAFLALLFLVLLQSCQLAGKYLAGQTTVSKSTGPVRELFLPAVSVCPGFRGDVVADLPWMSWEFRDLSGPQQDYDSFPKGREEAERLWKEVTFDFEDLLLAARLIAHGDESNNWGQKWVGAPEVLSGLDPCLEVRQHSTVSGRCFTFDVSCPFHSSEQSLSLYLNVSGVARDFDVLFHPRRGLMGLNDNFWPEFVLSSSATVSRGQVKEMSLYRSVMRRRALPDRTEDDYFDCLGDFAARAVSGLTEAESFCYFPSLETVFAWTAVKNGSHRYCSTSSEFNSSMFHLVYPFFMEYLKPGCAPPGDLVYHSVNERIQGPIAHACSSRIA